MKIIQYFSSESVMWSNTANREFSRTKLCNKLFASLPSGKKLNSGPQSAARQATAGETSQNRCKNSQYKRTIIIYARQLYCNCLSRYYGLWYWHCDSDCELQLIVPGVEGLSID